MIMFIPLVTISSSISTMVAIALDRFREIVQAHKLSQENAIYVISGIWIWSIAISAPQLYEYSAYVKYEEEYNITSCGSYDIVEHFETIYATIIIILSYAIPLIAITICYIRTMMFVWKAGKTIAGIESQIFKKRVKIVKLLILITVVFAVLWSPYFIVFGIEVSRYLFLEVFISIKGKYNSMGYHTTITILGYRDCITKIVFCAMFYRSFLDKRTNNYLETTKSSKLSNVNSTKSCTD